MVYHMPNCIVLFSKSSFFIQKAQSTIANSLPPDPLHTASTSLSFSSKHPNPPQTTNYISPSSADAPDIKTPVFRKTSGIPAPASARCGFLWCTLRTVDSTARYWSDKREDAYCFFLPGTSRYRYCRSSPIHTARSGILLSNIYGKMSRGRCFSQIVCGLPACRPSWDLFSLIKQNA